MSPMRKSYILNVEGKEIKIKVASDSKLPKLPLEKWTAIPDNPYEAVATIAKDVYVFLKYNLCKNVRVSVEMKVDDQVVGAEVRDED